MHLRRFVHVFKNSDDSDDRSRIDSFAQSFVVETYVAAGDRGIEFLAGLGDAVDDLRKLPHDVGLFGIAEVEAVGGADRCRSGASNFARGFRDGVHGAEPWIEIAPASVAVE